MGRREINKLCGWDGVKEYEGIDDLCKGGTWPKIKQKDRILINFQL